MEDLSGGRPIKNGRFLEGRELIFLIALCMNVLLKEQMATLERSTKPKRRRDVHPKIPRGQ